MATRVKKVNNWYIKWATEHLTLSMDDSSLYCEVVSESDENVMYRVEMNEETMVAIKCNCVGCQRWGHCKHMDISNSLSYKVAPVEVVEPVVEETTIFEVERKQWYVVNHRNQVWCQDGTWMCAEGAEFVEMVKAHLGIQDKPEAQVEEVPSFATELPEELRGYRKKAVSTDLSTKGNLNGNRGFNLLAS